MEKLTCMRCGHTWQPRKETKEGEVYLPLYCPYCKQSKWQTPATKKIKKEEGK